MKTQTLEIQSPEHQTHMLESTTEQIKVNCHCKDSQGSSHLLEFSLHLADMSCTITFQPVYPET